MVKCEKCGATVPNESKFCLNCGSPIDSSAPRHFSLEEIAGQQQAQENSAFSITPDTPDDDPETYLPPIGAKEHSEIPMGEIDPEYFNHKPLPNIQAADPLELLDSDTPELPPIGFSDQMQIDDIKMPEGIRHYHGNYAVPRNMQFQTVFPISRNGDITVLFDKAVSRRQMMSEQAHGDKEHFSVIPKDMQVKFGSNMDFSQSRVCSFNEIFVDEYVPERDIPSAKPKPKPKPNPEPVKIEKKPVTEIPTVSLKKNQQTDVDEKKKILLQKKTSPPVEEKKTISLQKDISPPVSQKSVVPEAKKDNFGSNTQNFNSQPQRNDFGSNTQNFSSQPQRNDLGNNTQSFNPEPMRNDFGSNTQNFSSQPMGNDFGSNTQNFNSQPMRNDFRSNTQNFNSQPIRNDFGSNTQNFSSQPMRNDFGMNNFDSQNLQNNFSSRNNSYAAIMEEEKKGRSAKIIAVAAVIISVLAVLGILFMIFTGYYKFDQNSQESYSNGGLNGGATESADLKNFASKNDVKWSNLNNGGLAAEDDEGNIYYSNSSGCMCKLDTEGESRIIYNGARNNRYITYISVNKDRLYFLASMTGQYFSICSTDKNGEDFKVYSVSEKPSKLFSEGDFLYYITEDQSKINRINIETEAVQNIYNANGEQIENVFIAEGKMYILRFGAANKSTIDTFSLTSPSYVESLYLSSYGGEIVPLGICCCGDRMFVVDYNKKSNGKVYSAKFDGSDVKYLGGNHVVKISAYDNYIYYLYISETLGNAQKAVEEGTVPDILSLGRMKTNGLEMADIQKTNVLLFSFAGGRIYYLDGSFSIVSMLPDGTDMKKVS